MRILHATQPTSAGVARYVAGVTAHQARAGHVVAVLRPPGGDLDRWLAEDVAVHDWEIGRQPGPGHLGAARRLAHVVSTSGADVVHLHSAAAGLAGRLALRGRVPTIYQPHAWSFLAATGAQRALALAWERFAARWTDVVVCVSEQEREDGRDAGVSGELVVVPNGVDADAWPAADDTERRAARDRLGWTRAPSVVCVGRLSRQKGQDLLVAAWPSVRAAVPEAVLHLVGEQQDLPLPATDGVVVHGPTSEVHEAYAAADVVVLPSRWEGLSLTLLEAMATGRSIVASTAAGNVEVLAHRPDALVDVHDADALARALVVRLRDPSLRDDEAAAHRRRVVAVYSITDTLDRVTDLADRVRRVVDHGRG